MRKSSIIISLVSCFISLFAAATAFARTDLFPVEELKKGMTGYAKTVVSGDTIETFPVTVLGVTGNDAMGYQILIEASGSIIEKTGGIAQGMSGSPVYIDGRLAGAVAYGKAFDNSNYCFLTPIGTMLELLDKPVSHFDDEDTEVDLGSLGEFLPKGTGLMASGFTSYGIEDLNGRLAPFGLDATETGAADPGQPIGPLEPGSSVGVALVQGDLTLGALGTVTWTDDKGRVLAFGHPFLRRGAADFYLTKAWILAALPNLQTAYKVGYLGPTAGRVTQDRSAGIAGQIGGAPSTISMFVSVSDQDRSNNGSCRVRIVDDPLLAPELIGSVVTNTASKVADHAVGGSARITFDITSLDSKGLPLNIHRENMYFSNGESIIKQLTSEILESSRVLLQNKLEKVDVRDINVNVDMSTRSLVAEIQSAKVVEEEARPGDTIHIEVELKPYRADKITRTVAYKLPKDARGTVELNVRGGASLNWIRQLLRQQQKEAEAAEAAEDEATKKEKEEEKKQIRLRDYVQQINKADRNNDIVVEYAIGKNEGKKGEETAASEEEGDLASLLTGGKNKQSFPIDLIVDGEAPVTVKVKGAAKK